MKLSHGAINLLRFVLMYTGKKEIGADNSEVNSPRRLNGEESAQRRHFFKNTQDIVKAHKIILEGLYKALNIKIEELKKKFEKENPKKDGEDEKFYQARLFEFIKSSEIVKKEQEKIDKSYSDNNEKTADIKVSADTLEVIKKYYKEFGEKIGFVESDDKFTEEVENLIK